MLILSVIKLKDLTTLVLMNTPLLFMQPQHVQVGYLNLEEQTVVVRMAPLNLM